MKIQKKDAVWAVAGMGLTVVTSHAANLPVPNYSFASPTVPNESPWTTGGGATDWQEAPAPAWFLGDGYTSADWAANAGVFLNVPWAPVDNLVGSQAAFIMSVPGVELYQDLPTYQYQVGRSYQLTVAACGGGDPDYGYTMQGNATLDFRLYYRDPSIASGDNRVTIGDVAATFPAGGNQTISHLTDYTLTLPAVQATDPCAGQDIGIQLISNVFGGGFWDVDDVRLVSAMKGDANYDGTVDNTDLTTVLQNLGVSTSQWSLGNFEYAAGNLATYTVNNGDLTDVLQNLGTSDVDASSAVQADGSTVQSVPEPGALCLLTLGAVGVLARRQNRAR